MLSIYIRDVERTPKIDKSFKQNYINNGNKFTQISLLSIIQMIDRISKHTLEDILEKIFKYQYCTLKTITKDLLEEHTRKYTRDMFKCTHC